MFTCFCSGKSPITEYYSMVSAIIQHDTGKHVSTTIDRGVDTSGNPLSFNILTWVCKGISKCFRASIDKHIPCTCSSNISSAA